MVFYYKVSLNIILRLFFLKNINSGVDFNLEQPRLDFTGYRSLIDHLGWKLSGFGEAAAIPYASYQTIFDQKGEQKLRLRVLNFTLGRRVWRGTNVSLLSLEDTAMDEDKNGSQKGYKIDRQDLLISEIQVKIIIFHLKNNFIKKSSIL